MIIPWKSTATVRAFLPSSPNLFIWAEIPLFGDTLFIVLWIVIVHLGRWIWMNNKNYGDLGMEAIINTCLNFIGLDNKHVPFIFSFFQRNLFFFFSFLAGITILLFLSKGNK